jgi:hypothetical protein
MSTKGNIMLDITLYGLIGFLLLNGLPHALAGADGLRFRLFARDAAPPQVNLVWGLANIMAATILATWRLSVAPLTKGDVAALLVGAWLAILMFVPAAKWFHRAQLEPATPRNDAGAEAL